MKQLILGLLLLSQTCYAVRMGENAVNVSGDTMTGNLTINANLTQGAGTYTSSLSTLTVNGNTTVTGNITVSGTAEITGVSDFNGAMTVDSSVTVNGSILQGIGAYSTQLSSTVLTGATTVFASLDVLNTSGTNLFNVSRDGHTEVGGVLFIKGSNQGLVYPNTTGLTIFYKNNAGYNQGISGYIASYDSNLSVYTPMSIDCSSITFAIGGGSKVQIDTNGNVGVGVVNPTNIIHVVAGSATDPIADSWTNHPSFLANKNILKDYTDTELKTEISTKLKSTKIYKYTHKPLPYEVDVPDGLGKTKKVTEYRKHDDREHLGITVDDCPDEILVKDKTGVTTAIDLFDYCNFLMSAVKSLQAEVDILKARP